MTNDDIARLLVLVGSATPGPLFMTPADPWTTADGRHVQYGRYDISAGSTDIDAEDYYRIASFSNVNNSPRNIANAKLFLEAREAIRALLDELEKARADAERYRWLRDHGEWEAFDTVWLHEQNLYGQGQADMDAAIDQARAAQEQGNG